MARFLEERLPAKNFSLEKLGKLIHDRLLAGQSVEVITTIDENIPVLIVRTWLGARKDKSNVENLPLDSDH
jgi:hypothetical protein